MPVPAVGMPAPDFTLPSTSGEQTDLFDQIRALA